MSFEHRIQRVMNGEARGVGPTLTRAALSLVEPVYAGVAAWRNRRYDRGNASIRRLPRPVISIGNLTTGGTGKTPVVRFLAEGLRRRGLGVGILSRGYKSAPGTLGDEQRMLKSLLGDEQPRVEIEADPDRYAAGIRLLERAPSTAVLLLDDGFQHRRLHRDLDIVLLHASEPFGYGHVLPRGLLRERPAGLRRADVVIVTNSPFEPLALDDALTPQIRQYNAECPIFRERHEPACFRDAAGCCHPLTAIAARSAFCFSGLGSPGGFESAVGGLAGRLAGTQRFPDHHDYTADDLRRVRREAQSAQADVLVTTEKDWVKLSALSEAHDPELPVWRLDVTARFSAEDEQQLLDSAMAVVGRH